ncbi:MAG: membrane dipeptidase, partial [Myxococcales bacterium]|nr:membrane dipeptidase [Myxococcales bacterium]
MANDDWSHGGRGDAAEAHTVPGGGGGFGPHDRETSLPTSDLDSSDDIEDERDAALMRAVAIQRTIAANADRIGLATSADDAARLAAQGRRVAFQSIENSWPL